jgi:hypothetical protein
VFVSAGGRKTLLPKETMPESVYGCFGGYDLGLIYYLLPDGNNMHIWVGG